MQIVQPYSEIVTSINGEAVIYNIERAARTCYRSEGLIDVEIFRDTINISGDPDAEELRVIEIVKNAKSGKELVAKLIKRGHDAMLEFGGQIHVLFVSDRGVSHEIVRHRMASFAQESTRYCNYTGEKFAGHIQLIHPQGLSEEQLKRREEHFWNVQALYDAEIAEGVSPQIARGILPNALRTEINVAANVREWRHIFRQRTASGAHPQMKELMRPLLEEFKKQIPLVFDDITYE